MADLHLSTTDEAAGAASMPPACPYPGLRPFDETEAALFFGRRRLVEELLTQLEFQPMVLLLGSSGCGKSSVVRAGVIPQWRKKYPDGKVILARPGANPFHSLAQALTGFPERAVAAVRSPGPRVFRELRPLAAPSTRMLLAMDCFEEVFTLHSSGEETLHRHYLDSLVDLFRLPDSGIQVLLVLRDDFVGRLRTHEDFYRVADNSLQRMTQVSGDDLRESIEAPARARGVRIEDGVALEIQQQAEAREGMLPLLQDALATWWREEDLGERLLRRATLERIGGIPGALPQRLTRWFDALPAASQKVARQTLLRLVDWAATPEGTPPVLRSATRASLSSSSSEEVVQAIRDQQILVFREALSPTDEIIELGHESIVAAWPAFRDWIADLRSGAGMRRNLQEDALRWSIAAGRNKASLQWRGDRLNQALERQQRGDWEGLSKLSALESRFLQACSRAAAGRTFRNRAWGIAAGLVAIVSLGAALLATARIRDAHSQKRAAEIKAGLGWLARAQTTEGSTDAGFFAAFATGFEGAGRPAAESLALPLLANQPPDPYPRYLTLRDAPARTIEATRRMASAPKPFLWSAPFAAGEGPVQVVAFSLDGRRLASAGETGRVHLWSMTTGNRERTLDGSASSVEDLAFSPAGAHLASGHVDGSLILWESGTGTKTASFQGHAGPVRAVAFSPAGTQVASGGDDGIIKIWNVETAGPTRTFTGHSGPVRCLAFGPGGVLLASGGSDRLIRVWDVIRGEEVNILSGHLNPVQALAFSPSNRELASVSQNQPVILWDFDTHQAVANLPLSGTSSQCLAFSPDGTHLAVAGDDGRLRIWPAGQDRASVRVFSGHSSAIRSVAFGPDGRIVATGSDDGTVKIWAVRDAWKSPGFSPAASEKGHPEAGREPGASGDFDWFRYVRDGWVHDDQHRSVLVWRQLPQGLPFAPASLPPNSWIGILQGYQGEEQTRLLLLLALEAQNWDAAALLRQTLPHNAGTPALRNSESQAAKVLEAQVRNALEAGHPGLADWRMRQGDLLFSSEPEWAFMRAKYLEVKGQSQDALKFYRQADRLEAWQAIARLSPDGKEAVAAWRRVLPATPEPTVALYLEAGNRAAEAGDAGAVREFFTAGIRRFSDDTSLRTAFARQLIDLGALDEALAQFEALAKGEGEPDRRLVQVLQETGCLEPVLRLLGEKAAALRASGPAAAALECMTQLGRLFQAAQRPDDAILVLKDRISYLQKLSGSHSLSGPLDDLAKALMQAGRRDEALTVMRARIDLLKAQPPGAELSAALQELQIAFASAGLDGEAIAVLQERLALAKGQPGKALSGLLAELADQLRQAGRTEEALQVLEERVAALRAEGKDPVPAIRNWAEALHSAGKTAAAWAACRQIAELPGATAPTLAEVASWGALRGHPEDATALFDAAAARAVDDPERALVGRRRGWALLEAGGFEEAFQAFGMAKAQLESSPDTARLIESELLSGLAAASWLTNRKGAALDEFEALWRNQKEREQWQDAGFLRDRNLPETGRKALLELHAVWHERMHAVRRSP